MNTNLPPDMLKELQHTSSSRLEKEFHISGIKEDNAPSEGRVYGSQHNAPWPVMEFHAKPESWFEIGVGLAMSLFVVVYTVSLILGGNVVEVRRGLFLLLLWLWVPLSITKSLIRRLHPQRRTSVILEAGQLVRHRGRDAGSKIIRYEQICSAQSPSSRTGPIAVNYYEYDEQSGALYLLRLRSMILPETENDASLCYELKRRSFGPAPACQVRIRLAIRQCCQSVAMVLALWLYVFGAAVVAAVLAR